MFSKWYTKGAYIYYLTTTTTTSITLQLINFPLFCFYINENIVLFELSLIINNFFFKENLIYVSKYTLYCISLYIYINVLQFLCFYNMGCLSYICNYTMTPLFNNEILLYILLINMKGLVKVEVVMTLKFVVFPQIHLNTKVLVYQQKYFYIKNDCLYLLFCCCCSNPFIINISIQ